jgi:biopolymer transport protein ExbD
MVFVALFLAILFLFPASQSRVHALQVHLPQHFTAPMFAAPPPYLNVSLTSEGGLSLDNTPISLNHLTAAIRERGMARPIVLVRAEPNTAYGFVALTLDKISEAGVSPSDICFDPVQIGEHRKFEGGAFSNISWQAYRSQPDPGGCQQFYKEIQVY